MSSWGWKNDTLPPNRTIQDVDDYTGVSWDNHGRPVQYDFGGPSDLEQWLTSNPNRVNLGRVGLVLLDSLQGNTVVDVTEDELEEKQQTLDLWTGVITSSFKFNDTQVVVQTVAGQENSTVAFNITSDLLQSGQLAFFIDFPWNDGKAKFSAPFVGSFNQTELHSTSLLSGNQIMHQTDDSQVFAQVDGDLNITRDSPNAHRYTLHPTSTSTTTLAFSITFDDEEIEDTSGPVDAFTSSESAWDDYWSNSGFVDVLTGSTDSRAEELQRRIVLSRYLMRVNEAGDSPPQEVSSMRMVVSSLY